MVEALEFDKGRSFKKNRKKREKAKVENKG
jgi:hypothetical protein